MTVKTIKLSAPASFPSQVKSASNAQVAAPAVKSAVNSQVAAPAAKRVVNSQVAAPA
jgi:hypothetical protein